MNKILTTNRFLFSFFGSKVYLSLTQQRRTHPLIHLLTH